MKRVLVVSPHPDDETLGCGGTLLKHQRAKDSLSWLLVTSIHVGGRFSLKDQATQSRQINRVAKAYRFKDVMRLDYPTTALDRISLSDLVARFHESLKVIKPEVIYLPFAGDIHSDHRIVFDAAAACLKWFRTPSVERALSYETLSETDQDLDPGKAAFKPNVFVNIHPFLKKKIAILNMYKTEVGAFPFPRSGEAVTALAKFRGSQSGHRAAEGFMLLREIQK